jgi:predicted ATPase
MIRAVKIRRFKRFGEVSFELNGRHVVLAGPNNMGKTTILQAISAWTLGLRRWKELNDFQRHRGFYTKAPIARQAFSAVPLRRLDLMWANRDYEGSLEIEIVSTEGWTINMEFIADSTEQIFVRPNQNADPGVLRSARLESVFVPAMTGLSKEEPLYARQETVADLLGQAKPGDVLRNLLVQANQSEKAWSALCNSIEKVFGYRLLPPDATGAYIVAEYQGSPGGPTFDISSAGSGFQQILMLLTFLNTRPATVLLLDEPDAHLHVILQDAIYGELREVAARQQSQLVIATHSEVIINSVDPRELWVMLQTARPLAEDAEKSRLVKSLRILSNTDIMLALDAEGILYVEGRTDLDILRAWAKALNHRAQDLLQRVFWKPTVWAPRSGAEGVKAQDHYEVLKMVPEDLAGLVLVAGDANPNIQSTPITAKGLQRLRWKRYEIESYLLHPESLKRFVSL